MNRPLKVKKLAANANGTLPQSFSLVSADKKNIVIETVKKAEDNSGMIIRLYEAENKRGKVTLRFGLPIATAYVCDMLENTEREIAVCDNAISLDFSNFEIITLKIPF